VWCAVGAHRTPCSPKHLILCWSGSSYRPGWRESDEVRALRKFHVGERFLLRQFRAHSVPQAYRRNWKELNGGTHHANLSEDRCDSRRYRHNRCRQLGSSRSLVWLQSLLLSSLWLLSSVPSLWVLPPVSSPVWVLPVPSSLLGWLLISA